MRIFEIFGLSRSGHHAIINWMIKNICGYEVEMRWKLNLDDKLGLMYINEANLDTEITLKYLQEHSKITKYLLLSYENSHVDYSILNSEGKYYFPTSLNSEYIQNFHYNKRIIIIRNFYNNLASRLKANEEKIVKSREGEVLLWEIGQSFIDLWKDSARKIYSGEFDFIKYEDWISNKSVRENFLKEVINCREVFDNHVSGTKSSFEDMTGFNDRHKQVDFPKEIKDLIKKDNELHFLIGKLGYEYVDL